MKENTMTTSPAERTVRSLATFFDVVMLFLYLGFAIGFFVAAWTTSDNTFIYTGVALALMVGVNLQVDRLGQASLDRIERESNDRLRASEARLQAITDRYDRYDPYETR